MGGIGEVEVAYQLAVRVSSQQRPRKKSAHKAHVFCHSVGLSVVGLRGS